MRRNAASSMPECHHPATPLQPQERHSSRRRIRQVPMPWYIAVAVVFSSRMVVRADVVSFPSRTTSTDTSTAASVRLPSSSQQNNNIVLFDPMDSAATYTATSSSGRSSYDGKDVKLGVDVSIPAGIDVVLPGVDAVYHPPTGLKAGAAALSDHTIFDGTAPRTANQKDRLQEAFHADYSTSVPTRNGNVPKMQVRDDEQTLSWMQAATTGSYVLKKLSKGAFRVQKTSSSKKSNPKSERSKLFPWMTHSSQPMPSLAPAPLNTTSAMTTTATPAQSPYPWTKPIKEHGMSAKSLKQPKASSSSTLKQSGSSFYHSSPDDRDGDATPLFSNRKSSSGREKNNHNNLDDLFGGDNKSEDAPAVTPRPPRAYSKKSKSHAAAASKVLRTKHHRGESSHKLSRSRKRPDGDLMVVWHRSNPPIYIPIPHPPPIAVPLVAIEPPTVAPTTAVVRPVLSIREEPAVRFLRSAVLAVSFQQTRIPSTEEINAVVALFGGYLGESTRRQTGEADLMTAVTLINTSFRLGSPFEFVLELQMDNVPSDIPTEMLESIVEDAMADHDTVLAILSRLPTSNVFRTTSSVSVSLMESVERRSRVGVSVAAAASGGLLVALLLGVLHMRREKRYRRLNPNITKEGNAIAAATVSGTTFKSKSVGFSDDLVSLSSFSESDQGWKRQIYESCGDHNNTDDEVYGDASEDAETPQQNDPLAPPASQPLSEATPDDATVDSYVPVAVVDLIRRFTPAQ